MTAADTRPALVRAVPLGVAVVALSQLIPAIWMTVAPHAFWHGIGAFGPYNRHYLGDVAAFSGAIGLLLVVALWRPVLREPALLVALFANVLHAVNHFYDVHGAQPRSGAGTDDAIQITILAGLIAVLWLAARWRPVA